VSYSREQVGVVKSNSGALTIVCPSDLSSAAQVATIRSSSAEAAKREGWCGEFETRVGKALAFAVPIFDGEYPVYASYGKDGELLSIEIDMRD
jgi:hypothetical protein